MTWLSTLNFLSADGIPFYQNLLLRVHCLFSCPKNRSEFARAPHLESNAIVTSRVAQIARDQNRHLPLGMFAGHSRPQKKSSSLAIRQQGRLLEHPEDFEDDNDNDNYSDYVENVSVHAGTHIKSGVRWPAFIQIERAIAISKSPELNPDCLATQKPLRGEARRLIARLGCVIDPAALRIVENDL